MSKSLFTPMLMSVLLLTTSGCQLIMKPKVQPPSFQKDFMYKRLVINNKQEAWVLSNNLVENWPVANNRVWFSSDKGILRFTEGQLSSYSTVNPRRQWQVKTDKNINWNMVLQGKTVTFKRCVTDFPKHANDHCKDYIAKLSPTVPTNSYAGEEKLIWVAATPVKNVSNKDVLWFAFTQGVTEPIYGSLCLSDSLCMSWQNWWNLK